MATSAEDAGVASRLSDTIAADGGGVGQSSAHVNDPASPHVVPGIPTLPGSPVVPLASNVAPVPESSADLARTFDDVVANVRSAYVGQETMVRLALCCLMAEGHLLVEDHPGVGKTTLAKALARSLDLTFGRVQFTADLLPSDVTGAMVFDRDTRARHLPARSRVHQHPPGRRAQPGVAQGAVGTARVDGGEPGQRRRHQPPAARPFMVIATQNPYDAAGTFPLPHSQRDRFLLRLSLGYPDRADEDDLLASTRTRPSPDALQGVGSAAFLRAFADAVVRAHVAPEVRGYVLDLIGETRSHPDLTVGASPRATLAVLRAAGAVAVSKGRDYVTPDDVKAVAEPALGHRVVVHPAAELAGVTASSTIEEIMARLLVPVGGAR